MAGATAGSRVDDAFAALEAALAGLAAIDVDTVPVGAVGVVLERAVQAQRRLEAQYLRVVRRFDSSGAAAIDGASSSAAWIRWRTRTAPGPARSQVATARRMGELPELTAAHAAGEISTAHLAVVAAAMDDSVARSEAIGQADPLFAQAARELDPPGLAKSVRHWVHVVDPLDALAQEKELQAQRRLAVSRTFAGAVHVDGLLPPESGAVVMAALEALGTEAFRATRGEGGGQRSCADESDEGVDRSTPAQRRADALVELCRRYLDSGAAPAIKGSRPHLSVTVAAESLAAAPAETGRAPATLEGVGPISLEAARRIACDAQVTPFRVDDFGAPVAYGRTVRTVPLGLRRYLVVRDRHCVFPGCDRPPEWCEGHHLRFWSHGGTTDASNTALVCVRHHHCLHEGGFTTRGDPERGSLRFYRPDGTELTDSMPRVHNRGRGRPEPRAG